MDNRNVLRPLILLALALLAAILLSIPAVLYGSKIVLIVGVALSIILGALFYGFGGTFHLKGYERGVFTIPGFALLLGVLSGAIVGFYFYLGDPTNGTNIGLILGYLTIFTFTAFFDFLFLIGLRPKEGILSSAKAIFARPLDETGKVKASWLKGPIQRISATVGAISFLVLAVALGITTHFLITVFWVSALLSILIVGWFWSHEEKIGKFFRYTFTHIGMVLFFAGCYRLTGLSPYAPETGTNITATGFGDWLYFSWTTHIPIGFGDYLPAGIVAKTLVCLQTFLAFFAILFTGIGIIDSFEKTKGLRAYLSTNRLRTGFHLAIHVFLITVFGSAYWALSETSGQSFIEGFGNALYYAATTHTTLGFGDISPIRGGPPALYLTVIQVLAAYLYTLYMLCDILRARGVDFTQKVANPVEAPTKPPEADAKSKEATPDTAEKPETPSQEAPTPPPEKKEG